MCIRDSFNYGFFPQSWENSLRACVGDLLGDDDPLDVIEVSNQELLIGSIHEVQVFGVLCLIDQGEVDWKVVSLTREFARANNVKSMADIEALFPGRLASIKRWFKTVKTFDGKPENRLHFDEAILPLDKTLEVIEEGHKNWLELKSAQKPSDGNDYGQRLYSKRNEFHLI
eukprot:TRINITY_DN11707_c0_g1_i2.p1 TRINITY_DN11707_c0_g1~~TRINITY_DN11707_c0_g1_i2.p1  ORF type:complete len:171 (+),score=36.47 TRINITY_DN11707_c0_g1_i2:64-576(+)